MIEINGNIYKLGLLDTCIISKILTQPDTIGENYIDKIVGQNASTIPCITIWSIMELRQRKEIYNKFLDFFSAIPFAIMKTADHILNEEFNSYPYFNKVEPILFTFSFIRPEEESLKNVLGKLFSRKEMVLAEKNWKFKLKKEKLDNILSLKKNFVSKNKQLNNSDAERFVEEALPQYVTFQNPSWIRSRLMNNETVIFDAFPSAKASLYTVFFRFYVANREPEVQDIFDILIINSIPYVDCIITENFQADILKKVKRMDQQFSHLEIETIKDLR